MNSTHLFLMHTETEISGLICISFYFHNKCVMAVYSLPDKYYINRVPERVDQYKFNFRLVCLKSIVNNE